MAKKELNLLQFAAGGTAEASATSAIMPHAALSPLCRMLDHAESMVKIFNLARSLGDCAPRRLGIIREG